eukprot:scaffold1160_cov147-Skeletonema_marinoi.AAC.1
MATNRANDTYVCTYGQSTEMTSLSRRTTQPSTEREAVERYNCLHCDGASKQTDEWNCDRGFAITRILIKD